MFENHCITAVSPTHSHKNEYISVNTCSGVNSKCSKYEILKKKKQKNTDFDMCH